MRIFVSVAAYQEPLLAQTITSLVTQADHPENLTLAVIDQHREDREKDLLKRSRPAVLKYQRIDPVTSEGVCWARNLAFALYDNETYLLQIDSHMIFDTHWDTVLIKELAELRSQSEKPILTVYPPAFTQQDNMAIPVPRQQGTLATVVTPVCELSADNAELAFYSTITDYDRAVPGFQIAAGFLFTLGEFVKSVPYDPQIYFVGEEQIISIQAWTRGWDIWHPRTVPLYHLYKTPGSLPESVHWHAAIDSQRSLGFSQRQQQSRQHVCDLLYKNRWQSLESQGKRTVAEFAEYSGIDYATRTVHDKARRVDVSRWRIPQVRPDLIYKPYRAALP